MPRSSEAFSSSTRDLYICQPEIQSRKEQEIQLLEEKEMQLLEEHEIQLLLCLADES